MPSWQKDFNTSHVTVYHTFCTRYKYIYSISIHPMLRFILFGTARTQKFSYFNTSHVTVYRSLSVSCHERCDYFNTSHVTVYPERNVGAYHNLFNFNTSHVTVYLMILSHFYLGIFHHFLYFTSFQHFLPADYKI